MPHSKVSFHGSPDGSSDGCQSNTAGNAHGYVHPLADALKWCALETQGGSRMAKRDRATEFNLLKGTCSTPCEKRDLYARVKVKALP